MYSLLEPMLRVDICTVKKNEPNMSNFEASQTNAAVRFR